MNTSVAQVLVLDLVRVWKQEWKMEASQIYFADACHCYLRKLQIKC